MVLRASAAPKVSTAEYPLLNRYQSTSEVEERGGPARFRRSERMCIQYHLVKKIPNSLPQVEERGGPARFRRSESKLDEAISLDNYLKVAKVEERGHPARFRRSESTLNFVTFAGVPLNSFSKSRNVVAQRASVAPRTILCPPSAAMLNLTP